MCRSQLPPPLDGGCRRWRPGCRWVNTPARSLRRFAALAAVLLAAIWALDGQGYFWPAWAWLGLAVPVLLDFTASWAWRHPRGAVRRVACVWALVSVAAVILLLTWLLTWLLAGVHEFWPAWALLGLATAGSAYSLIALHDRVLVARGRRALRARIDLLTRTRRQAVDAQAAELQRIERDLHDGAQARLVALTLQLGRAELRVDDQPEVRRLINDAQREAHHAIAELRDLARGIVPPLLADRGLVAAVESLAARYGLGTAIETTPLAAGSGGRERRLFRDRRGADEHRQARRARRSWVRLTDEHRALVVVVGDDGGGGADPKGSGLAGLRARVEALDGSLSVERQRRGDGRGGKHSVRVVIAEDLALLREGLVALLRENEIEVVAQVEDGPGLLRAIAGHEPDLAIVDVRLPPTFSDEGLRAAIEARRRQPALGVLVLSQYVETAYASELIGENTAGIGYLLKERIGDVRAFLDALERVAAGGTVLDRQVVTQLLVPRDGSMDALTRLTAREREVLELMAEGRSNTAIAESLVVTPGGGREAHHQHLRQARPSGLRRRPPARARRACVSARRAS